jgi:hypothetical protein
MIFTHVILLPLTVGSTAVVAATALAVNNIIRPLVGGDQIAVA